MEYTYVAVTPFGWFIHPDIEDAIRGVKQYKPDHVEKTICKVFKTPQDDKRVDTNGESLTAKVQGELQELVKTVDI